MSAELDIENRRLCPDGACVGVIGADGRCKVCGRTDDGAPQGAIGSAGQAPVDDDDDGDYEDQDDEADAEDAEDGGDEDRRLCSDEACVGLIGPDGKCKICGLPASS